ncbi:hypothetical protein BX666DRAFT_505079 [Dichotomocladium elegans]|nr:hypothetical protein BX666DRAFT_505079 [Dichotomocladium elegans]
MATASNWESFLSPHEVRAYSQFFAAANGGKSNVVQGREAVQFFVRSGIPNEILSDIWETADRDNLGYLTPETFSIALKLIACAQHGHDVSQPILSTVVPLPQFEGFNPDLHPISPNTTGPLDTVSPSDREKYLNIFRAHQPVQGLLDGVKAREIFLKSKLPKDILEQIWNLANVRKSGNLNQTEFVIAMHYIARMMDHTLLALPSHLPASVYGSAAGSISSSPVIRRTTMSPISRHTTGSSTISHMVPLPPPSRVNKVNEITGASPVATEAGVSVFGSNSVSNWYISKHQRQQFDAIFDRLDMHHTGLLPGGEAGNFFKNSRLPEAELARIWDLADSEQRGQLTRHEFAIAMFLIQKRLAGESLPNSLPASLTSNTQNQPAANILTQSAPLQSPPSLGPQTPPTQPLTVQEPLGDLLGDFDNEEQLTETTNAVNQLQYQIKNETSSLDKIKAQKKEMEQQLDQLRDQKEYTNIQKKHLLEAVENEKETLSKLQSAINSEEPDWSSARQDRAVAQSRLNELREELAKMTATLHEKKLETERLRREVHRIQKEKDSYVDDLYRLRQYVKQQEKPALSFDEIFGTPTFEQPQVDQTTLAPQHPDQEDPSYSQDALVNEFDNIFGASYDEPKRQAPPPPPPPHRRVTVRRAEVSPQPVVSSATSSSAVTSSKKHRAPPPPPPSTTAVTASAIVAGAAGASTAVGFQQEQSSEAEADVTTTDDDSEDEIPLSDLKAESARETVSAGFRDISPEDTIPLTPSVKGDAFNTAEAKNDSVNMDMATVTGTEGSQFDMDTNDISSSESTDVKTRESLVETKLRTEDINPRPTEPTEEGFNMVSKSFSSEDATMAVLAMFLGRNHL